MAGFSSTVASSWAGSGSPDAASPWMCRTTTILVGSAAPVAAKPTVPLLLTEQFSPDTLAMRKLPYTVPSAPAVPVLAEATPSWSGAQAYMVAASTLADGPSEAPLTTFSSVSWPLLSDGVAVLSGTP